MISDNEILLIIRLIANKSLCNLNITSEVLLKILHDYISTYTKYIKEKNNYHLLTEIIYTFHFL